MIRLIIRLFRSKEVSKYRIRCLAGTVSTTTTGFERSSEHPRYFNQADIARQEDSTFYLHIKIIGALRGIIRSVVCRFPEQKPARRGSSAILLMFDTTCFRRYPGRWPIGTNESKKTVPRSSTDFNYSRSRSIFIRQIFLFLIRSSAIES